MRVERFDEGAAAAWDAFVAARPDATCYHHRAWKQVAERAYRLETGFLLARDPDERVRGVLPLFVVKRPFQKMVTTGLFGAYGPLLADESARPALLAAARAFTERVGASVLQIKALGDAAAPDGLVRLDTSVTAILALDPDPQVLWRRFDGDVRTCVRQAQKFKLELRSGPGELEAFYDVLAENMHRKGSPIYGLGFMRELLAAFGTDAEIVTLWSEGKAISGAFVLTFKDTVYVPFASSRASAFHMRPNNLLYWEIIQRACKRGLRALDFGRSPRGSSTLKFKLKWRPEVTPVPFYVYSAGLRPPTLDSGKGGGVDTLVHLWQKLPRSWADAIGPAVVRWIA